MSRGGVHAERLRSFIERIERLAEERKALSSDITEVFAEAKSAGYDTKIIRKVIQRRAMDAADREEQDALLETYLHAIGEWRNTPLAAASETRADA